MWMLSWSVSNATTFYVPPVQENTHGHHHLRVLSATLWVVTQPNQASLSRNKPCVLSFPRFFLANGFQVYEATSSRRRQRWGKNMFIHFISESSEEQATSCLGFSIFRDDTPKRHFNLILEKNLPFTVDHWIWGNKFLYLFLHPEGDRYQSPKISASFCLVLLKIK